MVDSYQVPVEFSGPMPPSAAPTTPETSTETNTPPATTPDEGRPSWLPEKYKSPEDLLKSNQDAEKRLTQLSQELADLKKAQTPADAKTEPVTPADPVDPAATPAPDEATPPVDAEEQAAKDALESKGLDFDKFSQSFAENNGQLTDDDYAELEKSGIPKALVDDYIAGRNAVVEQSRQAIFSEVGGQDQYTRMTEWAAANMSPAEINSYNEAVESRDFERARQAVKAMHADFIKANGREPGLLQGDISKTSGDVFRSSDEIVRAMSDSKYKTDPAYRSDVERKIARSEALFRLQ